MSITRRNPGERLPVSRPRAGKNRLSRRLFLLLGIPALLGAVGCSSFIKVPSNPFGTKQSRKHPRGQAITGNATTILYASNGEFMAVLSEPRETDNAFERGIRAMSIQHGIRTLLLFNTAFQKPLPINPPCLAKIGYPVDIAFNKDDRLLIVSKSESDDLSLLQITPGEEEEKVQTILEGPLPYYSVQLSRGGDWLAGQCDDGSWELVDLTEPKRVLIFPKDKTIPNARGPITVVKIIDISPDGSLVATEYVDSDRTDSEKKSIAIWDLKAPRSVPLNEAVLPLTPLFVTSFYVNEPSIRPLGRFSPSSSSIAFRSKEDCVAVYQSANGALLAELGEHGRKISALDFAPTVPSLAVGLEGEQGTLFLWDIRKGKILRSRSDRPEDEATGTITALTIVPDGTLVQYGTSHEMIRQWDIRVEKKDSSRK